MWSALPEELSPQRLHQLLLGSIGPRPIAFASTVDTEGKPNLSPFSFFNVFGVNPTTLIFSPSRRGRDNTTKDTLDNVKVVPEVVINMVTYDMVHQASLASSEYPKGVDEFVKAGFRKIKSDLVRPFRVGESPVQLECRVRQVIETGDGGGAANLVVCEILKMHINEEVMAPDGLIDQQKIRLVGRMGRDWYCTGFGNSLFQVEKPLARPGIGIDALPENIRFNRHLTGNDLGRLGNVHQLPTEEEIRNLSLMPDIALIMANPDSRNDLLLELAKDLLEKGSPEEALKVLMLL
jgi:flavin reductase (DIM6/NTAB) family NADH-FMN oxidoreductase RutF